MRIISGTQKGRKLLIPKKLPARPTTDYAKESLFNILRHKIYFDDISVLDLYAGTGSISYEFASRGVPHIMSVDSHPGSIAYIEKVSKDLDFPIRTWRTDVFKFLEKSSEQFDVVFCDPPYDLELSKFQELIKLIFQEDFLREDGILIIEHHKNTDLSDAPQFQEKRSYGDSVFSFFEETIENKKAGL